MLTKQDLILLLTELEDAGEDVTTQLNKVVTSQGLPLDVLKFINDRRELDVTNFYKHIRKNYNNKKSKLYINIVNEESDPEETLTTLASFALQVLLYSKNVSNREMFLKHTRFVEIEDCLAEYGNTFNLVKCNRLRRLLKADLKAVESMYR